MNTDVYKMIKFILSVVVFVSFCAESFALNDGIGDPTVPASSVRSGLVKSPNPMDTSGNLVITGRVRGGKYFRGLVPYRDETEFGAPLGSEDIGSFLRNTAPITSLRSSLSPQPYYLPSSTVSSMAPGRRDMALAYPNIKSTGGTGDYETTEMPKIQVQKPSQIAATTPLYDYSRTRPLNYDPTDLERVITYDLIQQRNKKELSDALQKAGEGVEKKTISDAQKARDSLITEPQKPLERSMPAEPVQPGRKQTDKTQNQNTPTKTVYEQMLQEITSAQKEQQDALSKEKEAKAKEQEQKQEQDEGSKEKEHKPGDLRSKYSEIDKETAEATVGVHKSFATESNDKFNYYMRSAEEFLKDGKYYRAADAYSMAGIYRPDDPLAFAGKSHALFASGEYMSSAYFLSRAINIFPQYVKFKIDIIAMIPDKDKLESRIVDVKKWIQRSDSPELSFLLAYIYYQLDKIELAAEAIDSAAAKITDSVSVTALKQAIEKK